MNAFIKVPIVSVVIPTYNRAPLIQDALESVFAQTYKDYEIVVVDDGSMDNTREVLKPYLHRIRYVWQENQGVSAARNFGMQKARGTYVAFLDGDDIWDPRLLQTQVTALKQHPEAILSFTNFQKLGQNHEGISVQLENRFREWIALHRTSTPSVSSGSFHHVLLWGDVIPTSSVVLRRAPALEVGTFDEQFTVAEDYDYWLRLSFRYPVVYVNKVLVSYRVRETGLSGPLAAQGQRHLCSNLHVLEKHAQEMGTWLSSDDRFLIQRRSAVLRYRLGTIHLKKGEHRAAIREISLALWNFKTVGLEFCDKQSSWIKRFLFFLKPYGVWILSGLYTFFSTVETRKLGH